MMIDNQYKVIQMLYGLVLSLRLIMETCQDRQWIGTAPVIHLHNRDFLA